MCLSSAQRSTSAAHAELRLQCEAISKFAIAEKKVTEALLESRILN
jgi:hypothetical protein